MFRSLWTTILQELIPYLTISFALLDHTNKQVYTWYKKESYNLYKHDKYYIRLKDDGEFSLTSYPFIRQLQIIKNRLLPAQP